MNAFNIYWINSGASLECNISLRTVTVKQDENKKYQSAIYIWERCNSKAK